MGNNKQNAAKPAQAEPENKKQTGMDFAQDFANEYGEVYGEEKKKNLMNRVVGNNGFPVGAIYTLTGEIVKVRRTVNGNDSVYCILTTKEGVEISVNSVMGLSSLRKYETSAPVEVEYDVEEDGELVKKTRMVQPEVYIAKGEKEFKFERAFQPTTRNLLQFIADIADGKVFKEGDKLQFLGTVVRPYTAKEDDEQNGEQFRAGYQRAIEARLWAKV